VSVVAESTRPSPSVDPVRERIAEVAGQNYLDRHDAGFLSAALTAVLDHCAERELAERDFASIRGYRSPQDWACENTLVSTANIRAAIAAGLGETR